MSRFEDLMKTDRMTMEDLVSGRRRFASDIESWISSESVETGKTRKEILEESVRQLMNSESEL